MFLKQEELDLHHRLEHRNFALSSLDYLYCTLFTLFYQTSVTLKPQVTEFCFLFFKFIVLVMYKSRSARVITLSSLFRFSFMKMVKYLGQIISCSECISRV